MHCMYNRVKDAFMRYLASLNLTKEVEDYQANCTHEEDSSPGIDEHEEHDEAHSGKGSQKVNEGISWELGISVIEVVVA